MGLGMAPLATVVALQFTTPLFSSVLAILLLGEALRARRVAAIAAGFVGTVIIIRPGFIALTTGPLIILASAFLWGAAMIIIKRLGQTESSITQTFYASLFMTPMALAAALPFWRMPSATTLFWLIGVGLCATAHNLCITQAFKEAEITAVAPIDFAKLLWISVYAVWIFDEQPDPWTWAGAAIIFGAATYMAAREKAAQSAAAKALRP
jgi:drug/metabolite transporter (DMT)-like permease